jgi:phage baseplate assembly protein V
MADPTDIQRLLGDLAREGIVVSVDQDKGTARVEFAEELTTGDIPWLAPRAGKTRVWSPPSVGEQVLVLAPEADATRGIIIGSLSSSAHPHPANDGSTLANFEDGARIGYDPASHSFTIHLPAGAKIAVVADGGATWKGDLSVEGDLKVSKTLTADQDVVGGGKSLKSHKHTGVQAGGALSGPPQ